MSNIIFPKRRVDGEYSIAGTGLTPSSIPTFNSLEITGDTLEINGIAMEWPLSDGTSGQILTTDGNNPASLSFSTPATGNISHRREDGDTNTYLETDLAGTGLDNTIRFGSNGLEVMTLTEDVTGINNNLSMGEKPLTTMTVINSSLSYSSNFAPIHVIKDSYMYFIAETDLVIVDISNANPSVVSTTNFGFIDPSSIKISGRYAYIGERDSSDTSSSYIIDINNPASPILANNFDQLEVGDLQIQGKLLYSSDYSSTQSDSLFLNFEWLKQNITSDIVDCYPDYVYSRNDKVNSLGLYINSGAASISNISFDAIVLSKPLTISRFFLTQQNTTGIYQWAIQNTGTASVSIPKTTGNKLLLDSLGNSIIAIRGEAVGSSKTIILSPFTINISVGNDFPIIAKVNSTGTTWEWYQLISDTSIFISGMSIDSLDNIYVLGRYGSSPITLGSLPSLPATYSINYFLAKLSSNNIWQWSVRLPNTILPVSSDNNSVSIDIYDNVIVTFPETVSISYISKYTTSGIFQFTVSISSTFVNSVNVVNTDNDINIYIAGTFNNDVTIDANTFSIPGMTSGIFIAKLNPLGNCIWLTGSNAGLFGTCNVNGLVVNSYGGIVIAGSYSLTKTFGSIVFPTTTNVGDFDAFALSIDNNGNFISAINSSAPGGGFLPNESITSLTIDNNNRIFAGFSHRTQTDATWDTFTTVNYSWPFATGGTIQIGDNQKKIKISDLSDSINPLLLSEIVIVGKPDVNSILVKDNLLYATTSIFGNQSLYIYNISDSSNITFQTSISLNTINDDYVYTNLLVIGNYLFAHSVNKSTTTAYPHGVISIDLSTLSIADTYTISSFLGSISYHNNTMVTNGKYLYVVDDVDNLLTILNISDPTNITLFTSIVILSPLAINLVGRYLYTISTPNSTLTIYNYISSYYQHLETGSLYTNDLLVDGSFHVSQNLSVGQSMNISKGLVSQNKSSITGTLSVFGNINQTGREVSDYRQITGASPSSTLDLDYIINTAHTGTATLTLLDAAEETGVEYIIVKENANQVDIVTSGNDIIIDQNISPQVTLDFSFVRQTMLGNISSNIYPSNVSVDSTTGIIYLSGTWPSGASVRFGPDISPVSIETNFNTSNSTWIAQQNIIGNYTLFVNILGNADNGQSPTNIKVDNSSDIIVLSSAANNSLAFGATILLFTGGPGVYEPWIAKMNSSGIWQWAIKYTYPGFNNQPVNIDTDSSNNIYVAGNFNSATYTLGSLPTLNRIGVQDVYIAKLNSSGVFLGSFNIGQATKTFIVKNIVVSKIDGSIYVSLYDLTNNFVTIYKYTSSFVYVFDTNIVSANFVNPGDMKLLSNDDIIISGIFSNLVTVPSVPTIFSANISDQWFFVAKLRPSLPVEWQWIIGPDVSSTTAISASLTTNKLAILNNNSITLSDNYDPGTLKLGSLPLITNSNAPTISNSFTTSISTDGIFINTLEATNTSSDGPTVTGVDSNKQTNILYYVYSTPDNVSSDYGGLITSNDNSGFNYITTAGVSTTVSTTNTLSMTGAANQTYTLFSNGNAWYKIN